MPEVGIIIQARMGSSRLPGKVLKKIGSKPLLKHITDKLSSLNKYPFVVATSNELADDKIQEFCVENNIHVFRGSESDVLERYFECAQEYSFNNIVRLTADNPFVDVIEMDRMIEQFLNTRPAYMDNFSSLPIGVGTEIFDFKSLEISFKNGLLPHHREHVNEYIQENPEIFKRITVDAPFEKSFPKTRLTVDTFEDWERANYIFSNSQNEFVTTEEAIKISKNIG